METTEITTSPETAEAIIQPEGTQGEGLQPENLLKKIKELESQLEFEKKDKKEIIGSRDQVKAKLRDKETLDERLASITEELNLTKAEADKLRQENEGLTAFQQTVKTDLLNQLPEEHKAIAETLSLEKLREYVKLNSKKEAPGTETARAGGTTAYDTNGKKWDDFTLAEKNQIAKDNPKLYQKLFNERFQKSK